MQRTDSTWQRLIKMSLPLLICGLWNCQPDGTVASSAVSSLDTALDSAFASIDLANLPAARQATAYATIEKIGAESSMAFFNGLIVKASSQPLTIQGHTLTDPKAAFAAIAPLLSQIAANHTQVSTMYAIKAPPFAALSKADVIKKMTTAIDYLENYAKHPSLALTITCDERASEYQQSTENGNGNHVENGGAWGDFLNACEDWVAGADGSVSSQIGAGLGSLVIANTPCTGPDPMNPAPAAAQPTTGPGCDTRKNPDCGFTDAKTGPVTASTPAPTTGPGCDTRKNPDCGFTDK